MNKRGHMEVAKKAGIRPEREMIIWLTDLIRRGGIMKSKRWVVAGTFIAITFGLLIAGGCASEKKPTANLANADLAVQRAREANAINYAPLELRLAEDKLNSARSAADREEYKEARRLADEALADAQAAEAKATSERTRQMAGEMQESVTILQRNIAPSPSPAPMSR